MKTDRRNLLNNWRQRGCQFRLLTPACASQQGGGKILQPSHWPEIVPAKKLPPSLTSLFSTRLHENAYGASKSCHRRCRQQSANAPVTATETSGEQTWPWPGHRIGLQIGRAPCNRGRMSDHGFCVHGCLRFSWRGLHPDSGQCLTLSPTALCFQCACKVSYVPAAFWCSAILGVFMPTHSTRLDWFYTCKCPSHADTGSYLESFPSKSSCQVSCASLTRAYHCDCAGVARELAFASRERPVEPRVIVSCTFCCRYSPACTSRLSPSAAMVAAMTKQVYVLESQRNIRTASTTRMQERVILL